MKLKRIFEGIKSGKDKDPITGIIELDGFERAAGRELKEISVIKNTIINIEDSQKSLSGALLQIAKQGISIVHCGLANCPSGRSIGTNAIKKVIWQARN